MTHLALAKSLLVTGLLATSNGFAPQAEAKTQIGVYFGVPFFDSSMEDNYLYEPGYGWYSPEYRPMFRRHFVNNRVSCNAAARDLRYNGFRRVVALECNGISYTFKASKRGHMVTLAYNARTRTFRRI